MAEQTIQAVEKVPDTIDSINNEAKCTRRTKEKLLGARKALESLTQKVAIAVAEFAFASPREPPDKMSPGQDALGNAKECPSDLDTRVQEREAMSRRVSKYVIVAATSRFATPWSTRTQWSCFGFICCGEEELVRQVHTLFVRSEQQVVVYELQVQEEWKECGKKCGK